MLLPALVLALAIGGAGTAQEKPLSEVIVDFGQRELNVKSMSGFLHSLSGGQPPDAMILPLKPRLWRGGPSPECLSRIHKFGARLIVVVSDIWRGQQKEKMPYEDYPAWERLVRQVGRSLKGNDVIYDIWNEPETKLFWRGTPLQFLETFRRAHNVLRQELGAAATISGPSIVLWGNAGLGIPQFMDFCRSNRLQVNVLSWHELGEEREIPEIANHLRYARKEFIDNPDYAGVGVKEIQVNEIVGSSCHAKPGAILAWLSYLEAGGADGACKACWDEEDGSSSCSNFTLDGLLTPKSFRPRAAWWVYKLYSDGVGSRVASTSSDVRVVCLSSQGSAVSGQAQVLLGCFDPLGEKDTSPSLTLTLRNLDKLPFVKGEGHFEVTYYRIPNSGSRAFPRLLSERKGTYPLSADGLVIKLPRLLIHQAYLLLLRWSPSG
jgi:hypothetical protein